MHTPILDTLKKGDIARGLEMAQAAVRNGANDAQAHRILALALAMKGDLAESHVSLDRAISLAPQDAALHYQKAALFLAEQRVDEVNSELERSIQLNPNQLQAYVMQAQLALRNRDIEEAERLARLAMRIAPAHPWLLTLQGLISLFRREHNQAIGLLSRAAKGAPEDAQTIYALAIAYMQQGHLAFAEQAMRKVVAKLPASIGLRQFLADLIRQQERFAEAAEVIEAAPEQTSLPPDVLRYAGELWLVANNHQRALPLLRRAAEGQPGDPQTLDALIEALRRQGDFADGRHTIEAELARTPGIEGLWSARLYFCENADERQKVAEGWHRSVPGSVHGLHAMMEVAAVDGRQEQALKLAEELIAQVPGHTGAHIQIISHLYQNDAPAAVEYIQRLLPNIIEHETQQHVLGWLGRAQDRAGQFADAVQTWLQLQPNNMQGAIALPPIMQNVDSYPALTKSDAQGPKFLYGPPGSAVERVVTLLMNNLAGMRIDRMQSNPPLDGFQHPNIAGAMKSDNKFASELVDSWRNALSVRGTDEANIIDWLLWWDNALLHALRPYLPNGELLLVLRDPRQMLLDWLASGTFIGFEFVSPEHVAHWLAAHLKQLAELMESDLYLYIRIDIDAVDINDPVALSQALTETLSVIIQPTEGLGAARYEPGHWRLYAEALREPFAILEPIAQRLGYPPTATH